MTADEIRKAVLAALRAVAPEVEVFELDDELELQDQIEIDSLDTLNFVTEIHDRLGVSVPEADYGKLRTVAGIVSYLGDALRLG